MLCYIIIGILLNAIFIAFNPKHDKQQWSSIIPFVKIIDTQLPHSSFSQLIILIITQGMANTLIGSVNENTGDKGRLPDFELSCPDRIDKKRMAKFSSRNNLFDIEIEAITKAKTLKKI
ncbi:unnamed protein product [Rotaria magnacalcarata]|uniref:Uncharacterized protein n=1 Tax=Rotaria magnacalcarata TaxID=392030 RepID=A0A820CAY2_9BILA|nr:unnamed protein product [Rotaria magnacalcarata]